ncbi:dinucleotide-utilizing enzyme possibly involved in molybdopterin or thiamin biosynthesis [Caldisphaera lagunensis DSM 15908]|uniref:Dinucleotide-utilizing enzyme possibly involved in molybdopterin or thiamin biosynthesis n=1 Tax=Caldisphaera lagunensis (strain DSM 15908 / JCM 11604 / ANMR 0165 / IC-154) TaxID=1056495 RepID=L0A9V4_CALLD|nr:ThiF family adenylyltransferase [Caldisphaera lagunensis]AFZ70631.1 dinucleotide-utilizing enzyme possibly involved in molybdopterin or thiamin biosynthesis [Caldisphaera lagunensis DSM 15908]
MIDKNILSRFSRQILMQDIGYEGMEKIRNSKIAIVGCGALGSTQGEILARAGVGKIKLIDRDYIDLSNLHRTHMAKEEDALNSLPKAIVCEKGIKEIDNDIEVETLIDDFDSTNAEEFLKDVDLIIDGTDNLDARFLINDVSVKNNIPWIYAGVNSWYGNVMFIKPNVGPCLRCLIPENNNENQSCDIIPSIGTMTSLVSSFSSNLAIRYLAGNEVPYGVLFVIDGRDFSIEKIKIEKNDKCPTCGFHYYEFLNKKEKRGAERICGTHAIEIRPERFLSIDFYKNVEKIKRKYDVITINKYSIRIQRNAIQIILMNNGLAIVENEDDLKKAKELYDDVIKLLA